MGFLLRVWGVRERRVLIWGSKMWDALVILGLQVVIGRCPLNETLLKLPAIKKVLFPKVAMLMRHYLPCHSTFLFFFFLIYVFGWGLSCRAGGPSSCGAWA